jgi:arylsulfatase
MPDKLATMKSLFLVESAKNANLPIGGGLWAALFHPEDLPAPPYTAWNFFGPISRMPEGTAPRLGNRSNNVSMEVDVPAGAQGVLYALGDFAGGLTLFVKDGVLVYEHNQFMIERTQIKAKLPAGKLKIDVESRRTDGKPLGSMDVTLKVNGQAVAQGRVPVTAPVGFTANGTLDVGSDQGSPVSRDYFDAAPFAFNGTIGTTKIEYSPK